MLLPSRLEHTTLGDLLGLMYRERLCGVLELVDERGTTHKIGLDDGEVCTVETPCGPRLGEILVNRFGSALARNIELLSWQCGGQRLGQALIAAGVLNDDQLVLALTEQTKRRLDALFALGSARVVFRPARKDREVTPLSATEYLPGRARKRGEVGQGANTGKVAPEQRWGAFALDDDGCDVFDDVSGEGNPWAILGLRPGASAHEVRAAFRRRAQQLHPDANLHRSRVERARTTEQFLRLSAAYRKLVA